MARLQRMQRKAAADDQSAVAQRRQAEELFVRGLIDSCPRCGFEPERGAADADSLREHLRTCTDARAHAKHEASVGRKAAQVEQRAAREDAQFEAQNEASWKFLGGSTEQMWLLTDKQLRKQCEEKGVDAEASDREAMLAALARATAGGASNLLTHGGSGAG